VYQTVWARQLHLVFGTSTLAIATVLAAFMLGLGVGGLAISGRVSSIARPLRVYGALEIGIGLWALLFPHLLVALTPAYLSLFRMFEPDPLGAAAIQLVLVGALLVPPTAAMGATLPLLARFASTDAGHAGARVGLLYGVNTAGAVVGTAAAGFVALPTLGLSLTTTLAAAGNLALGVAALGLDRHASPLAHTDRAPVGRAALVAGAMAAAGFASLVYEVAWTRVLALVLGGSTYAFTVMLVAFLAGIGLGGRVGGPLADRWAKRGPHGALAALAAIEAAIGLLSYATTHIYDWLPWWYIAWFDAIDGAAHPLALWAGSLLLAGLVLTPPAVLMGVAFPVAVRAAVPASGALGAPVGQVYAANTFGSALGAAIAGFVLLPMLQVRGAVAVAVGVNLAIAAVLGAVVLPTSRWRAPAAAAAAITWVLAVPAKWDPLWMTAGLYQYASMIEAPTRSRAHDFAAGSHDLLFYAEGLSSVVTVAENPETGARWLANNGKVDASNVGDLPTQVLVSLLPAQHVVPRRSLVIGLASGITAGALAAVEGVESLEIVELEPAIGEAARFFDPWNRQVLDDPRTRLVFADGRNHVLRAAPGTWDLVVSEPSNPWISGVSNLFTAEFFALGRTRLAPGGVWCQWVQSYGLTADDLASLLGTFADVYPHVQVYATDDYGDLVLLGSDSPMTPSLEGAGRVLAMPEVVPMLDTLGLHHPVDVLARYELDRAAVLALAEGVTRNTDDNLRIEYAAPLQLHSEPEAEVYARLVRAALVPWDAVGDDPLALADLAEAYAERDAPVRAVRALAKAARLLAPDDPLRAEWVARGEGWLEELADELRPD
jgi:spermidine synthase